MKNPFHELMRQRTKFEFNQLVQREKEEINSEREPDRKPSKAKYYKKVRDLTKEHAKESINGFNRDKVYSYHRDGKLTDNQEKLVIDHKISLFIGFKYGINPHELASLDNLQFIPIKDNGLKGITPHIDEKNAWIVKKYNFPLIKPF